MPWATHSQLLTLAHVSAHDAHNNVIPVHPCWSDPLYAQLAYGTMMMYQKEIKAFFSPLAAVDPSFGTEACSSRAVWGEFMYLAQSAAVVLYQTYRMWNIDPVFVDPTYGPYAPLALCDYLFSVCDQRKVLLALATLTAWHKEPFETSVVLDDTVLPAVMLLFPREALIKLHAHAPVRDAIEERLRVFKSVSFELPRRTITYTNINVTAPCLRAYDALVQLAGVESLFGVPTLQLKFDVHKAVLQHYFSVAAPDSKWRRAGVLPVMAQLMTKNPLFEKRDNRLLGVSDTPFAFPTLTERQNLLQALIEKFMVIHAQTAMQYKGVEMLGRYNKGQFAIKHLQLAAAPPAFWSAPLSMSR
jgi:hypothetical protein